ncbi:MAG: hypothetical protein HUU20_20740 [Pirellulales bacterium]|nr:hypothetical protein [Pirellulales bacterium]
MRKAIAIAASLLFSGLLTVTSATRAENSPTRIADVRDLPVLLTENGKLAQLLEIRIDHDGPSADVTVLTPMRAERLVLERGTRTLEMAVPAVTANTPVRIAVEQGGKTLASKLATLRPVRKWEVYLQQFSHVDIGYTDSQAAVERAHWRYFETAIDLARRTAGYPPGAQFKWNVEVLWAVDSYVRQASAENRMQFIDAVRRDWIGLDALYANELTGLCRPEELGRLLDCRNQLSTEFGLAIDAAAIDDIPGYTWGLTSVLADAGVKYLAFGPNGDEGNRIGSSLRAWGDKPFYWVTPCGRHKILCWSPQEGYYGMDFFVKKDTIFQRLCERLRRLEDRGYAYDMVQLRPSFSDNGPPTIELSEIAKDWNTRYVYPKLIIATTSPMMREFERRYGTTLPEVRGDFTPYWEDGAASSALETGVNRAAAERLVQAETLWAMLNPGAFPSDAFRCAWRNVVLFDEHTWGASPGMYPIGSEAYGAVWRTKQGFARDAEKQSHALLNAAVVPVAAVEADKPVAFQVFNTSNWSRTGLVTLPENLTVVGDLIIGPDGRQAPSQRLSDGRLALLAADVPAFGAKRFIIVPGKASGAGGAKVEGIMLSHAGLCAKLDEKTGAIASLRMSRVDADLVDCRTDMGLNAYFYVPGKDPADAQRNGPVKIVVKESGPLVASLLVKSDAPGCHALEREVRMIDGLNHLEIINTVDKRKIDGGRKEGVHFGFAFHVPGGVVRMDIPWAVMRPEVDQIPGACKNWFTVQRWIDVSSDHLGVTWATIEAPLVELGGITAETAWIETGKPTTTLYSYVMNNYWHTNYRFHQEGRTVFRYVLRPHENGYNALESARFGIGESQPLIAMPASSDGPPVIPSRFRIEPNDVIVSAFKPSFDRKAWIIRLFGINGRTTKHTLHWNGPAPKEVWCSDFAEQRKARVAGPFEVPALAVITLRAELPD